MPLLVDDPTTNALDRAYEAPPERLVAIKAGRVVFASGQGPFQYSTKALGIFLEETLGQPPPPIAAADG